MEKRTSLAGDNPRPRCPLGFNCFPERTSGPHPPASDGLWTDRDEQDWRECGQIARRHADEANREKPVTTSGDGPPERAERLEHAAISLANALPDEVLASLRPDWGNTNIAVIKQWRNQVLAEAKISA